MLFINEKLNAQLTVKELDDEIYFDMYEIAKILEYAQPVRAIDDFIRRNAVDFEKWVTNPIDAKNAKEGVINLFLLQSKAVRAKEFQMWVAFEVLPTVRSIGWKAIQQYKVSSALAKNYTIPREELLKLAPAEIVDEVIQEQNNYRQQGYLPASEFTKGSLRAFWAAAIRLGYISKEGEALKDGLYYSQKYHNAYLPSGKWYAFKKEVGARIAKAGISGTAAPRPWEAKRSWSREGDGYARKKRVMRA